MPIIDNASFNKDFFYFNIEIICYLQMVKGYLIIIFIYINLYTITKNRK